MSSVSDTGPEGAWRRRGGCGQTWKPVEILAVVLGFMVYWPIGVGLIGWKMVQRRGGLSGDWFGNMRTRMDGFVGAKVGAGARPDWDGFGFGSGARSGNAAFDEWRKTEIERLEVERRKLEEAQREFAAFVEEARKAQDREEFERFMQNRARPQA